MLELQYIDKKGFIHFTVATSIEAIETWMAKKGIKSSIAHTGPNSVLVSEQYSKPKAKQKGGE